MLDTDAQMEAKWLSMLEAKPLGQQLSDVLDLCEMVLQFHEAGLRMDFPDASPREIFLRRAANMLGFELCRKVYGWAPDEPYPEDGIGTPDIGT
jgi:hypothetical protein